MVATDTRAGSKKTLRGCATCLTVIVACAIILPIGIRHLRQQARLARERQQAEWREKSFNRVKNGDHIGVVMDSQLLPMLATDNDCVKNLNELQFDMVEIMPEHAVHVSRLTNVRYIGFYDTRGADYVLEHSRDLPIEKLFFHQAQVSHDSLHSLANFPHLEAIYFHQVLHAEEIAILESLPSRITVGMGYPPEDESSHGDHGEQGVAAEP